MADTEREDRIIGKEFKFSYWSRSIYVEVPKRQCINERKIQGTLESVVHLSVTLRAVCLAISQKVLYRFMHLQHNPTRTLGPIHKPMNAREDYMYSVMFIPLQSTQGWRAGVS